jgi:NAD(P)-dependent dehydrogenase (short-subunit alcohol dehydrogenase family)
MIVRKEHEMTDKKIWFITGAGRGLGLDIAKSALAVGHAVVATRRDPNKVAAAIGNHNDLLAVAVAHPWRRDQGAGAA